MSIPRFAREEASNLVESLATHNQFLLEDDSKLLRGTK